MRKKLLSFFFLFSCALLMGQQKDMTDDNSAVEDFQPRVIILATGGTIAGRGESAIGKGYKAGEVPIEDLLQAVPEIGYIAHIKGEQVANIGSQDMDIATWLRLSRRVNAIFENDEADGIVVTHGTDTMEETAYFLSLTELSDKPVVLVGAMRPSTALSQDGSRNLLDAVAVAADQNSRKNGVMVAMNERIYTARDVDKTSTTNVDAFQGRAFGPIGWVHNGEVSYYYRSLRLPHQRFDVRGKKTLPKVEIVYGYAGADPKIIDFLTGEEVQGIVYAGVGNGNFSRQTQDALAKAVRKGVVVCRASRIGSGKVTLHNEVDDEAFGFLVADDLSPQKARILLMLGLTQNNTPEELQQLFFRY